MTARQCIALQMYVTAVVRYLETPNATFERMMREDKEQLERAFVAKVSAPDLFAIVTETSVLPDIL